MKRILVIISVSYDKNTKLAGTYVCRNGGRNALNVAITRAKNLMPKLEKIVRLILLPKLGLLLGI